MTLYHSPRPRRAPFLATAVVAGLVGLSIAVLFWPTDSRRVQRVLTGLADSLSCEGPISAGHAASLEEVLRANFLETTTLAIAGPESINGSFSREQLAEKWAELCATVTRFSLEFSHVAVDSGSKSEDMQARADAAIEFDYEGGRERQRRAVRFRFQRGPAGYQLAAVDVQPNLASQPEPRP